MGKRSDVVLPNRNGRNEEQDEGGFGIGEGGGGVEGNGEMFTHGRPKKKSRQEAGEPKQPTRASREEVVEEGGGRLGCSGSFTTGTSRLTGQLGWNPTSGRGDRKGKKKALEMALGQAANHGAGCSMS